MSNLLVHSMQAVWTSSTPALLQVSADEQTFVSGTGSNRVSARAGASGATASYAPEVAVNLDAFDELRFWIRSTRRANGTRLEPFYLEFSFVDGGDAPGDEHRWLVPVNQSGKWEQRRIGIENERRSQITDFRFKCVNDASFVCHIDELLAVREEMLADLERALAARLDGQFFLSGATAQPLTQAASAGDTSVVVAHNTHFYVGNRILVKGGTAGDETHVVTVATHDAGANTTKLDFDVDDKTLGTLSAGTAKISTLVPVFAEQSPAPENPAIVLTLLEAREDPERTPHVLQRDSFRPRAGSVACSVRASARAYTVDYEIKVEAERREHQLQIQSFLMRQLASDGALRINGVASPLAVLPPSKAEAGAASAGLAPLVVRIATRMETDARRETLWVRQAEVGAAPLDAPLARVGASSGAGSGASSGGASTGDESGASSGAGGSGTITHDTPFNVYETPPADAPPDQEGIVIVMSQEGT